MSLLLVTHELSLHHRTPRGHPERIERVTAAVAGLRGVATDIVDLVAPRVDRELLEQIHAPEYIEELHTFCTSGGGAIDADTFAVPATWDAALHAAGGGPAAVDALDRGVADTGFVAVRPPGHHAERQQAMGFCFFNNVAVTAAFLRRRGERVAIVDWDVHHGNGTQHSFYRDPDVLYVSLHEFPFYPGTGWVTEIGSGPGAGTTVNIPIPAATPSGSYLGAFERVALPILSAFAPDWVLISAGYDAHRSDPLGGLMLEASDYATMAARLATIVPTRHIVSFLEGGYDLDAIAESARSTVDGMLSGTQDQRSSEVEGSASRIVDLAVDALGPYWEVLQG